MQSFILWAALLYIAGALIRGIGLRVITRELSVDQRTLLMERSMMRRRYHLAGDGGFVLALFFLPPIAYYVFPLWALLNALLEVRWLRKVNFPLEYQRIAIGLHVIYVGVIALVVYLVNGWIMQRPV